MDDGRPWDVRSERSDRRLLVSAAFQAGTEEFIDRRMADGYEVDVQALQDEAPRDANASLVALARELIEVRGFSRRLQWGGAMDESRIWWCSRL